MSEFWELWSKADAGDVGAEQQVVVLVAQRCGYRIWKSKYAAWHLYSGDKEIAKISEGYPEPYIESEAWVHFLTKIPDYMSDLNAAFALKLQIGFYLSIDTPCIDEKRYSVEIRSLASGNSTTFYSQHLAHAIVAAWWKIETGENQP